MRDFENTFALLLLCWLAIQSGHRRAFERAESDRGLLVLACRRRRLLDCRSVIRKKACTRVHSSGIAKAWHDWIQMEQFKRLGLSIWVSLLSFYHCQVFRIVHSVRSPQTTLSDLSSLNLISLQVLSYGY